MRSDGNPLTRYCEKDFFFFFNKKIKASDCQISHFYWLLLSNIMAVKGLKEDVLLVEFVYLVFICMPGESYRRRLGSLLLHLCDVFRALIISLVS